MDTLSKEIVSDDFVNLAHDCVQEGAYMTGLRNFSLATEYAKQEAIGFMTWVYSRGFFVQWKDGVAGHIRQENQILFSAWQPLESTYEQYLLHKQNKEQ